MVIKTTHILSFLLAFNLVESAQERLNSIGNGEGRSSCRNEFPLKETVSLLKKIVEKYGERRSERDLDGNEWSSILIDTSTNIQVDGREFQLNSPGSTETTFFLEVLELLDEEVFVVPSHTKALWSARHPDKTYLLHKITFNCGQDEVACGLQCCSCRTRFIQNDFLEEIAEKRKRFKRSPTRVFPQKYFNDYQIIRNGTTYSLEQKPGMNCRYRLSQFDDLYKRRASYNIRTDTIFYKCPPGHGCCSLGCVPISKALEIQQPSAEYSMDRPQQAMAFIQHFFFNNSVYIYGFLIFLTAGLFLIILLVHIRKVKTISSKPLKLAENLRHRTCETQTSRLSLDLDSTQSTTRLLPPSTLSIGQMRNGSSVVEMQFQPPQSPNRRPHSSIVDYQSQRFEFLTTPTEENPDFPRFDNYSHTWNPKRGYNSSNPYQSTTLPRNSVTTFKPLNSPLRAI